MKVTERVRAVEKGVAKVPEIDLRVPASIGDRIREQLGYQKSVFEMAWATVSATNDGVGVLNTGVASEFVLREGEPVPAGFQPYKSEFVEKGQEKTQDGVHLIGDVVLTVSGSRYVVNCDAVIVIVKRPDGTPVVESATVDWKWSGWPEAATQPTTHPAASQPH